MVKDQPAKQPRVDAVTIASRYRRIGQLIDVVCDKLAAISHEAELMVTANGASHDEGDQ